MRRLRQSAIRGLTCGKVRKHPPRRLALEPLEPRMLMTLAAAGGEPTAGLSGHGGICLCPICTGQGLEAIPVVVAGSDLAASNPLSSLPQLSSNPGAAAKLYLDFNGHFEATWGGYSNASTPVFDRDGDPTTFSLGELNAIQEVWARVAEDYAPFQIDVTTIAPGSLADRAVAHIAIGGHGLDWYGASAGGVAYVGGFYNGAPNVGYVFSEALGNGNARYVAEAASHEAGHLFGLWHQAEWNGTTLVSSYHYGNSDWAPIMGVGYYAARTTWNHGPTPSGYAVLQADLSILAGANNAFGYRADDFGGSILAAAALPVSGTNASVSGLIGANGDQDVFSFATSGGNVGVDLNVAAYGPNLDAVLELWDAAGTVVVSSAPAGTLGASIYTTVGAGTYYLVARSAGGYGNLGTYFISGVIPEALPPEIGVTLGGLDITSGGTVDFGVTTPGNPITQTFTVHNGGTGNLTLQPLNPADLPAGFEIVANLGSTLLAPGQTTTFQIRMTAVDAGMRGGSLPLVSSDGNESPFVLVLAGEVVGPEIAVRLGGVNVQQGGAVSFGVTTAGTPVTRTITVLNSGTAALTLAPLVPAGLPAGFSLIANLASTTLLPGESTTFVVRLSCMAAGSYSGQILLTSNDASEGSFSIQLSGVANPAVRIIDNGGSGFWRRGSWSQPNNRGYQGDVHTTSKGSGSKQANWAFGALPNGQYHVWASWTGNRKQASNAPFQIMNGSGALKVKVNQRYPANALWADGGRWKCLASVHVTKGWVTVRLSNAANGTVVADAIRLVPVAPAGAHSLGAAPAQAEAVSLHPEAVDVSLLLLTAKRPAVYWGANSLDDGPADGQAAFEQPSTFERNSQPDALAATVDLLVDPSAHGPESDTALLGVLEDWLTGVADGPPLPSLAI
ncbi:MAG: choice-of-anchor D domain-containing protein [Pirellulaceae bacterium]